ncbi:MAG: ATP-dependent helicase [Desulfobacteraceae bacterium]|nr:ATP-dependent helicase [Desulfobacteraceae bacterium]
MKPTDEQQRILDATGRVLLINARAGTGKTTTLQMIAAAHPDLKILYLVFNRKAKEGADGKFPSNVEIRTVHSLAFTGNIARWKDQVGAFTIADILPFFKGRKNAQQFAAWSHDFLEFFMNSPFPKVEEAMEVFQKEHLSLATDEVKTSIQGIQDRIVQITREILSQWYRQERPCPHDFYLKLFHREGDFYRKLDSFDLVMVDEGQDLSPIMLDALEHCRKRIIIVGDTHQQIYSFRYAIDAMKRFPFDEKRDLTMSFRFGKEIADLASLFIREAKGEKDFRIKGNPEKSSRVAFYTGLPRPKTGDRWAILSRTNLALFEKALGLRSLGVPFSLQRNIGAIFFRILDVHWLSKGEKDRIRDPLIQSFENLEALERYAKQLDDFQLASMTRVVREYARILPDAVYDMIKISKSTTQAQNGPGMILSTVHGAKGQEYDRVYIDPDVADSLSRPGGRLVDAFGDEANITYVGFTRAIWELCLHQDFKGILTSRWQAAIKPYEPVRISQAPKPSFPTRKRTSRPGLGGPRSGQLSTEAPQPQAPCEKPFKIGDRVRTSHGTGTIVQVDGGKYLVDLDRQQAQLWEKAWGLKKA